ncbi:MAG: hypothetical protein ACYSTX_05610 [Planctomycetota bacterium]|jgi:outer membrane lipoprotein-sorting protein
MSSRDEIEKSISELVLHGSDTADERVLNDALAAYEKSKTKKAAEYQPSFWRMIMKSKITKLAIAAVIIIAVLIGIKQFGGTIDGTSVAWGEVVEQINNYTRYKCRQRVVRKQGPEYPTMQVYHLNLSQRRQEVENGDIHVIDMRGTDAITVELYPNQMKATVTKLVGFGPRKDPHIIEMVKRFDDESTERLGTKEQDGKVLYGFRHLPNEYNDFTVWVDSETKLPVEIELKHLNRGQTIFLDDFGFDFELDESDFSTDIPDGYEVKTIIQDYRPVEPKEISAKDIRSGLNHTAYTVGKLVWIEKLIHMQVVSPLMGSGKVYLTGIVDDDGNNIIIDQSNIHSDYKEAMMEWMLKEDLVLESPSGVKLYTHPNGSEYARLFLESFAEANSEFFDINNLSEERFTRMIVMPDETILGLSSNKQMSDERLEELVESLVEIKAN